MAPALHDILTAGGSPRGSLYFHFPKGKEQIGAAALTLAGESVRQAIAKAAETSENAEMFLTRIVRSMASRSGEVRLQGRLSDRHHRTGNRGAVRGVGAATRSAFQKWELEIKRGLFRLGIPAGDADLAATTVLSQLEGALLLARTYRSLEPLRRAEQAVKLLVRGRAGE